MYCIGVEGRIRVFEHDRRPLPLTPHPSPTCPQDASTLEEGSGSVADQDLGDAVAQLASKLSSAAAGTQRTVDKAKSLQESLAFAQREADEAKAAKVRERVGGVWGVGEGASGGSG